MFLYDAGNGVGDALAERLMHVARMIGMVVFGLLPLIFVPYLPAPLGYTKILVASGGLLFVSMFAAFAFLRQGALRIKLEVTLLVLWVAFLAGLTSSLFSGDFFDSFWGTEVTAHSGVFAGVLALTALVWMMLGVHKQTVVRLYLLLGCSAIILAVYHILRIMFGTDFLSFGVLGSSVSTPFSEWNSLAIYFGLVVILSLIALEQLTLSAAGRLLFLVAIGASLLMLSVINFQAVFIVLGLFALIMIMYGLTKGKFRSQLIVPKANAATPASLIAALATLLIAIVFVVGGSVIGSVVSQMTGISYVEVRPSLRATTGIAKAVLHDDAFLGVGPNRFVDAWRLHRDPSINATIFWNTNFQAGFGYIPTLIITHGVIGFALWIVFFGMFLYTGLRTLLRTVHADAMWYFIALSSFVSSVYLWGMSWIYVPGPTLLLLAAATTGIFFGARYMMQPESGKRFSFADNQRAVFVTIASTVVVVVFSVGSLYYMGRHYAATVLFVDGVQELQQGGDRTQALEKIVRAFDINRDDVFARQVSFYEQGRLQEKVVAAVQQGNLTEADWEELQKNIVNSVESGKTATAIDATEPENWSMLGRVYATAVPLNIDQAYELAKSSMEKAQQLDPQNPARLVSLAELELLKRNTVSAREYVNRAIALKSNYTDAMYILTQIEITEGNVDAAIESTRATTILDPKNPVRFYQLGVLQYSASRLPEARASFEKAIELLPDYSNARYFLAFVYGAEGNVAGAREQLERVRALNPENTEVQTLLKNLSESQPLAPTPEATRPIEEASETVSGGAPSTEGQVPESPLLSPVNTSTVPPSEGQ